MPNDNCTGETKQFMFHIEFYFEMVFIAQKHFPSPRAELGWKQLFREHDYLLSYLSKWVFEKNLLPVLNNYSTI